MMHNRGFAAQLAGGHPNSLGNTVRVVEQVLRDPARFAELFACYRSTDAVVRLRTSSAVKRVCQERPELVIPYIDRLISEVAALDQASAQWTLAQLFGLLRPHMSAEQIVAATDMMKKNIAHHDDWIVLNMTLKTMATWAAEDAALQSWLTPHLRRIAADPRTSVAKTAARVQCQLGIV